MAYWFATCKDVGHNALPYITTTVWQGVTTHRVCCHTLSCSNNDNNDKEILVVLCQVFSPLNVAYRVNSTVHSRSQTYNIYTYSLPTIMNCTIELGRSLRILLTASSPLSRSLHASTTSLPPSARYHATSKPIPQLAPVTIITRPVMVKAYVFWLRITVNNVVDYSIANVEGLIAGARS